MQRIVAISIVVALVIIAVYQVAKAEPTIIDTSKYVASTL